jgi:D-alanyl-lipoteichoic acid acyltransferase DltB (MBOAT superfamily)
LFFVFLVSGLWHGAKWTFVIWGALHGFYLISGILIDKLIKPFIKLMRFDKWPNLFSTVQKLITFALVAFAWIFFRAKSFSDAIYISTHLFTRLHKGLNDVVANIEGARAKYLYLNNSKQVLVIAVFSILFLELVHYFQGKINIKDNISKKPAWFRWSIYYIAIMLILIFGVFEKSQQFIYFQF